MLQCRNHHHGKSIAKRWIENGLWYGIQRCRKCDVWEKVEIDALNAAVHPTIKRTKIEDENVILASRRPRRFPKSAVDVKDKENGLTK